MEEIKNILEASLSRAGYEVLPCSGNENLGYGDCVIIRDKANDTNYKISVEISSF